MIDGLLMVFTIGPVLTVVLIALPAVAAGTGVLLVWSGLERKSWWPLRLLAGALLTAFGIFGLIYMTIT